VGATFDLIGHSLGAMVAVAYAARTPHRLNSLVVVDSALKITPAGARYMNRLRNFPPPVYRNREEAIRRFRLLPVRTEADETLLAHVAGHGVRQLPDGGWTFKFNRDALAVDGPQDLTPLLGRLTCPILFVRGAHSTLMPEPALAALVAATPFAQSIEIPKAHHHVMLDNPTAFESATRGFLNRAGLRV
jgi:pimeloyl-ACP methyl ester carboxylesterase